MTQMDYRPHLEKQFWMLPGNVLSHVKCHTAMKTKPTIYVIVTKTRSKTKMIHNS